VHGEPVFRELEQRSVERALQRERVVIAPGGGWFARPDAVESLPEGTVVVWLQVSPTEAARRLEKDEVVRPLLAHEDMASRLQQLEGERTLSYSRAHVVVGTDGSTPEVVAEQVAASLVSEYGIDGRAD
jgi:shikimate kinase